MCKEETMRDNDLLDGAWDASEEPKPKPKTWKRNSCRDLDKLFGIDNGDYEDDLFVPVRKSEPKKEKPRAKKADKPVRRKKRRAKATRINPEDAQKLLQVWVKKLLLARKKVQKYRQAVKRYQSQGRI
jgi:hypothetical protein